MNEVEQAGGGGAGASGEPDASGHTHESACLNCGAKLAGDYCQACGQKAHLHRTLGAFGHDLLHGVLHLEGKTWRTLRMLAWRPGELTRRYIEGERAKFVSPMATFLFSVFLMFALFNSMGGLSTSAGAAAADEILRQAQAERTALDEQVRSVEQQRELMQVGGRPTTSYDARLAELEQDRRRLDEIERKVKEEPESTFAGEGALDLSEATVNTGWPWLDKRLQKAIRNPSLSLYKLQTNAYKYSWALIPISVPLMWLLFAWRRQHWQLYDHTVFVTYSLSYQCLLFVLAIVLARLGIPTLPLVLALGTIVSMHVYWQFRGAYSLSPFSAMWRMTVLTLIVGIAVLLFGLSIIALGTG